jgi:uncharacterized protein (TIGR00288 family)
MANWEKLVLNFDSNCCSASTCFPLSSSSTLFQSITEKFNLIPSPPEARVAVLVDCDNTTPDILEHALKVVAQFGRVVVRRGYGNHDTLAGKWQEGLLRLAFTPCLQYQFASGKNTSDIALALDALEALFDDRADTFCLVTSDSDFAHLCRKLRERGATVYIVGESKSPAPLRNASDQFFEWVRPPAEVKACPHPTNDHSERADPTKPDPSAGDTSKTESSKPAVKRRPRFLIDAVTLLAADTADGKVGVSALGSYLKRADPSFSPKTYGHSSLLNMIKTYDLLTAHQEAGGHWSVRLT